jgi:hypothetical protein
MFLHIEIDMSLINNSCSNLKGMYKYWSLISIAAITIKILLEMSWGKGEKWKNVYKLIFYPSMACYLINNQYSFDRISLVPPAAKAVGIIIFQLVVTFTRRINYSFMAAKKTSYSYQSGSIFMMFSLHAFYFLFRRLFVHAFIYLCLSFCCGKCYWYENNTQQWMVEVKES